MDFSVVLYFPLVHHIWIKKEEEEKLNINLCLANKLNLLGIVKGMKTIHCRHYSFIYKFFNGTFST